MTNFNIPDNSGVNSNNTRRALSAIGEISKGYKGKSLLWFEKGSAFISGFLAKVEQGNNILDYDYNDMFEKQSFGKTVVANVTLERGFDSESAALLTFLKLNPEQVKVVLSKETAFCCVGSVDKDDQRITSIVFAKNNN